MRATSSLAAAALLLAACGIPALLAPASADEVPNPFSDIPANGAKKRQTTTAATPPAEAQKPLLAPMNGATTPAAPASPAERTGSGYVAPAGEKSDTAYNRAPALPPVPTGPPDERARGVERGDLAPVLAGDGSGLPLELWQGLDVKTVETLISRLEIPPRSPALHGLWHRLVTSEANAPAGDPKMFEALRVEALFRSGLVREAADRLAKQPNAAADPVLAPLYARSEIALQRREQGCAAAKSVSAARSSLPKPMKLEAILTLGYCAAAATNPAAAGLAADLARDEGLAEAPGVALLDALAVGRKPPLPQGKALSIIDYRLFELSGAPPPPEIVERAQPSLLALLATETAAPSGIRLAAAEAALRLNAITPDALAGMYSAENGGESPDALLSSQPGSRAGRGDAGHRAQLFKAAEAERTPLRKVRLIRAFLDDSRRAGLYLPALEMSAKPVESLQPVPEIGWFAETAIEVLLAARKFDRVRSWASFGGGLDRPGVPSGPGPSGGAFAHWFALADIADPALPKPERGAYLAAVEEQALRGRFSPDQLHRLATVLDALDYNVPMRLWEAASRTPQPTSGHLPPTGVLSELQDASKKKEFGRTVLLAMDALGPHGAEGAHMIALGDAIRGLRRAGLDADARRLGFEAVFAAWPRFVAN